MPFYHGTIVLYPPVESFEGSGIDPLPNKALVVRGNLEIDHPHVKIPFTLPANGDIDIQSKVMHLVNGAYFAIFGCTDRRPIIGLQNLPFFRVTREDAQHVLNVMAEGTCPEHLENLKNRMKQELLLP